MNLFESVGAGVKAVAASLAPSGTTPFSNWGTGLSGSSSASGYLPAGAVSGNADFGASDAAGSRDDYSSDVGEVSLNGVVSAAVSAIAEAFCAAPFVLEQRSGDNWNRVEMHPLIELLHNPNPHYGRDQLWEAEIAGELITGNGYMRAVWNRARTQPVELWHESLIAPVFDLHHFIGSYRIFVDGRPYPLAASALYGNPDDPMRNARVDHALHFRYRLNRRNPRFGESPLLSVYREIAGDNIAATYQTAVLKNGAGASFFLTAKEGATLTTREMETVLSQTERRLRREGAGRVAGSNLPVDFHKISFSPDELALDKLPAHYEARICAAIKTPPMVLGFSAGDGTKTYANYGEAIDDFWQRNIIPLQNRKGGELEAQLFPLFGMDKSEWRIGFDRSQIAALQDDEGALYDRVTKAVAGGWMQPNEAREKAKLPALEEAEAEEESVEENEAKSADANWDEVKHPRADNGQFGDGSLSSSINKPTVSWNEITPGLVSTLVRATPHPFTPQGRSVSKGLQLQANAKNLAPILKVIDKLHGDGELPTVPLSRKPAEERGEQGKYEYSPKGETLSLSVTPRNPTPYLTVIHEIGHFLDHKGMGEDKEAREVFSTHRLHLDWSGDEQQEYDEQWTQFHAAVTSTRAFQFLMEIKEAKTLTEKGLTRHDPIEVEYQIDRKHVAYLLAPEEVFARAYTQYIVTRSGSPTLRKQLAHHMSFSQRTAFGGLTKHDLHYPEFWDPDEFEPIAKALDELFERHGWIAPK